MESESHSPPACSADEKADAQRSMLLITATRILSALTSHMDIGLYAMRGAFALELAVRSLDSRTIAWLMF